MGDVYLAEDPRIERRLALKTVRLLGGSGAELEDRKRRLLREAKAAGRILHPNAVTLFDAGEDQGLVFLAFEYVEGHDLSQRLERGPMPVEEALRLVRQVAGALDSAHRQNIIHRDIKPSNIFLTLQGDAKIGDFGIAKLGGQSTELTQAGAVIGSPRYMSPEQVRGERVDGSRWAPCSTSCSPARALSTATPSPRWSIRSSIRTPPIWPRNAPICAPRSSRWCGA
jgi:serine/threonine-protein kinase